MTIPDRVTLQHYVAIARPDHWIKNALVIPGAALAFANRPDVSLWASLMSLSACFAATCLISSANYTINEWLDAAFDRYHPTKRNRPAVSAKVSASGVYTQWLALAAAGLIIAWQLGTLFLITSAILLAMGIVYNVQPLRTKDRLYLDVLSESVNNPLRFLLGWFAFLPAVFPPSSVLLSYWMGGAYLMAVKRYSEFRQINDPIRARLYRRSFQRYTERTLLLSAFFFALTSALFLGVFLIKHRIELVLSIPFLSLLFAWYLEIGMRDDSAAQRPEKLYRETAFMAYVLFVGVLCTILLMVRLPWLDFLVTQHGLPR